MEKTPEEKEFIRKAAEADQIAKKRPTTLGVQVLSLWHRLNLLRENPQADVKPKEEK